MVSSATRRPLRELERARKVGLGEDQRELLAAVSTGEVDLAHAAEQELPDGAQDRVAGLVAMGVVDLLEVVEVEEDERERVADAVGATPLQHELLIERAPVCQAR